MKKLEMTQMEGTIGGGKCEATVGVIIGFGLGCVVSGGALLWIATGAVALGVGVGGAFGCPW